MKSGHVNIHEIHYTYWFLGCHILMQGGFKIQSRNAFFIVFDNIAASLHRNLKSWASERTLICHTSMSRNTIDFGYNSGHVAL